MLVSHQERPRELKWYHAGPMLYGDWGTSRFYVLGLAFYYSLHASFYYVLGVCALVAAVGWAYTIVCRSYPDGGGVYSAARHTSRNLAVVGALLLFADYIITASLSAIEGMHYFGLPDVWVPICAISAIALVGIINYIGPRKAGTFALIVAMGTLVMTLVLLVFAIPHLPAGWANIHKPSPNLGHDWLMLVNVVLALSGVEAVANMTGIMVEPVGRTSKKSIIPVLLEVVVLNLVFAVAINAIPALPGVNISREPAFRMDEARQAAQDERDDISSRARHNPAYAPILAQQQVKIDNMPKPTQDDLSMKNAVLRFMGLKFVGSWYAWAAGIVFGLLLLSAVNTAVGAMVSIQYVMSRDRELPHWFTRLNWFGVPWIALLPAVGLPILILCFVTNLEQLADLYAIGVVGAITINLGSCSTNRQLPLKLFERLGMGLLAVILLAIELTLAYDEPHALYFASAVLVVGLGMRLATKRYPTWKAKWMNRKLPAAAPVEALPTGAPTVTAAGTPAEELDMTKPHLLVATRGGKRLLDFSAKYAQQTGAILFILYIRQINVIPTGTFAPPTIDEDPEAQRVFQMAADVCKELGVPMVPIYVISPDVPYTILDFAATYNVQAVLMGVSRVGTLMRALRGDVISAVADQLPPDIPLLIHA